MENATNNKWHYWEDIPSDKEEELLEKIAKYICQKNVGFLSLMVLESFGPVSNVFAELGIGMFGPFLEVFRVDMLVALFRKKENYKRLIDKIDKYEEKKKKKT